MKKTITIILLMLVIPTIVFSEVIRKDKKYPDGRIKEAVFYSESREIARIIYDKNGNASRRIGRIPDGVVREYYESEQPKVEMNYKKGKRKDKDIDKSYYVSDNLKSEEYLKDGKLDGIGKQSYKNGELKADENYKSEEQEGLAKLYYKNGELLKGKN
ncbi:unnamed protein product, partial [marine sediment metagenome]